MGNRKTMTLTLYAKILYNGPNTDIYKAIDTACYVQ